MSVDNITDDVQALIAEYLNGPEHVAYFKTRNCAHVWRAYCVARQCEVPLPTWVLAYFDACVGPLLTATNPDQIARALDLAQSKGGRSKAAQAKTNIRNVEIARRFLSLKYPTPKVSILEAPEAFHAMVAALQADEITVPLTDLDCAQQVGEEFHLSDRRVLDIVYNLIPSTKP